MIKNDALPESSVVFNECFLNKIFKDDNIGSSLRLLVLEK